MIYKQSDLVNSINKKNLENFEKNGGLKMYMYEENSGSEKDSLLKKMKEIDSKYEIQEYSVPEIKTLGLEEMEYNAPSVEEVEKRAEESLASYKENQLEDINLKHDIKIDKVSDDVLMTLENKDEKEEDIHASFERLANKSKNQNIKKGLARSSIFENALKEIEGSKQSEIDSVNLEYEKKLSTLENEKNILENQKQNALTSFDISYATKLQSKIASINSEIAKEQSKVDKYNNDIMSQETAYKKEQEKQIAAEQKKIDEHNKALQKVIDTEGIAELNRRKTQEKYYAVNDYLLSIPKQDALNELKDDPTYRRELGSFYSLLYAQMLKR